MGHNTILSLVGAPGASGIVDILRRRGALLFILDICF